jgi:hypothetical protein
MEWLIFAAIGLLSGLLSGLLGLGGGIVIVPALTALFTWRHFPAQHLMQIVTATSLATIFITSIMTIWEQNKRKGVQWSLLPLLIPGIVVGTTIGVWLGKYLPTPVLQGIFAVFCLLMSIRLLFFPEYGSANGFKKPPVIVLFLFSLMVGVASGLLGIGGGLLLIPLLLWLELPMSQVSATSASCVLPVALAGALSAIALGWHASALPLHSWGFVYWPGALVMGLASLASARAGVFLAHYLPQLVVKRIFAVILLFVAWRMFPFQW